MGKVFTTTGHELDCSHWAKKFDSVKHIYAKEGGTMCGSVAHCLGNNYALKGMVICPKCQTRKLQQDAA